MKLYFIRHGKTISNLEGRFQGSTMDSELLPEAYDELNLLGQELRHIKFDEVYSSDLPRAITSTEIILKNNDYPHTFQTKKQLREWHLGNLEGKKISIAKAIYPKQIKAFYNNLAQFSPSVFEAETLYQVTHRIIDVIQSLDENDDNVLIVGHGASLSATIHCLLGYEPSEFKKLGHLDNASLTILETTNLKDYHLIEWNNIDHLEKIEEMVVTLN
ncbi:histidine phosphatase family protein [Streptococcus zalophi]|uniref:Histidine phosphatase family protein n=1 Tax=Streptococcus zalophi TaxID=640031 RepID=A0A934P930_9STRE|nr:histidine phosphatase family protein [Streptococcus zalophi]MBJ8349175.1 histidine phosphatase family protein [Streptococcus zalophi]MCR8967203.1 histidine phosphatase family protein [Streptococcus zalophi]